MEWINKIKETMTDNDDRNPTVGSLLYMLNHMSEEYAEYKKLGTVEYLKECKEKYESAMNNTNKELI